MAPSEKWSDDVCIINFFKICRIPSLYLISVARFTVFLKLAVEICTKAILHRTLTPFNIYTRVRVCETRFSKKIETVAAKQVPTLPPTTERMML
jgi:hypothetical protein